MHDAQFNDHRVFQDLAVKIIRNKKRFAHQVLTELAHNNVYNVIMRSGADGNQTSSVSQG